MARNLRGSGTGASRWALAIASRVSPARHRRPDRVEHCRSGGQQAAHLLWEVGCHGGDIDDLLVLDDPYARPAIVSKGGQLHQSSAQTAGRCCGFPSNILCWPADVFPCTG